MFGINDPWILLAYALCILSAVVCVVYGIWNWNTGGDPQPSPEDARWARAEDDLIKKL